MTREEAIKHAKETYDRLHGRLVTSKLEAEDVDTIARALLQAHNDAIEAGAKLVGDEIQGELELVNSGDATIAEVRGPIRRWQSFERRLKALKIGAPE